MDPKKTVDQLWKKLLKGFEKNQDRGYLYPAPDGRCRVLESHLSNIQAMLEDSQPAYSLLVFEDLARWHLRYSQFLRVHRRDCAGQRREYAAACWYGYLALWVADQAFDCVNRPYISLRRAAQYWAQCILAGWWRKARDLGERMIASIHFGYRKDEWGNDYTRVIGIGLEYDFAGWFLLELHCRLHHTTFDHSKADYPRRFIPYEEVLAHWDTPDPAEVDRLVWLLADRHLEQTVIQDESTPEEDEDFFEFDHPILWLYPYEILAWLAIRAHLGLANPPAFSHPLMQQPLAEPVPGAPFEIPRLEPAHTTLCALFRFCPDAHLQDSLPPAYREGCD